MKIQYRKEDKTLLASMLIVALSAISFWFALSNLGLLQQWLEVFNGLMFPFIFGFGLAFLLNEPVKYVESKVFKSLKISSGAKRTLATIICLILSIILVTTLLWLVVPSLLNSLNMLISQAPEYAEKIEVIILNFADQFNINTTQLQEIFNVKEADFINQVKDFIAVGIPALFKQVFGLTSSLFNVLLGIMAGVYILIDKERFVRGIKRTTIALLPAQVSSYLIKLTNRTKQIFYDFIIGKAIDSAIIGVLCYIGMSVLNLPYAILLSVFVGVTNMIPVFGPFIGAIPGLIILTIIDPIYFIYFGLFILALQQLDGNVIGPLILGDKLGMPSLFILFSVVVGGGLFGVLGMFLGVPLFALVMSIIKEVVEYREAKKANNLKVID